MSTQSTRSTRMQRDERRKQLVESALRVAQRNGFENVTLRAVAQEANITTGMVHYCFQDKEELQREMVRVHLDQIVDNALLALAAEPSGKGIDALREDLTQRASCVAEELLRDWHRTIVSVEILTYGMRGKSPETDKLAAYYFRSLDKVMGRVFDLSSSHYNVEWESGVESTFPIITDLYHGLFLRICALGRDSTSDQAREYVDRAIRGVAAIIISFAHEKS